jgi:hypothetical protein
MPAAGDAEGVDEPVGAAGGAADVTAVRKTANPNETILRIVAFLN